MKDYTIKAEEKKDYILDFEEVTEGKRKPLFGKRTTDKEVSEDTQVEEDTRTYNIYFADGKKFGKVVASEANLKKIEEIQERQATAGVSNMKFFKARRTKSGIMTAVSAAVSTGVGVALTSAATGIGLADPTGLTFAIGTGIITILGTIPAFAKFMKDRGTVKELEKIEYRNDHNETLGQIQNYDNALVDVSSEVVQLIEEETHPFSILNIERFSQKDLETIIDNIGRQNRTGLEYVKKPQSK